MTSEKQWYEVQYSSEGNFPTNDKIFICADSLIEAQDLFFDWLRGTDLYGHMWRLNMEIAKCNQPIILGSKVVE